MSDSYAICVAKAHYFVRQGLFNCVTIAAAEGLRRHVNDPYLRWLSAYGSLMQDRVQDAIRELDTIRDKPDINIAACMALLVAHKKCKTVDQQAVRELESRIREERKQAGELGLLYAGTFLFLNGRYDKAREYLDRAAKLANGQTKAVSCMKGWNDLLLAAETSDDGEMKKAVRLFDEAGANERQSNLEAALGKCMFFELRRNYAGAMELCSAIAAQYATAFPQVYVEKARLSFLQFEFDAAFECAQRAVAADSDCVDAHRFTALLRLARDADYSSACEELQALVETVKRVESRNLSLMMQVAQLFTRFSSRRADVLGRVSDLLEQAVELSASQGGSLRADALASLGTVCLMCSRVSEARKYFNDALRADEGCVGALMGLIRAHLLDENVEEAAQQLDFINEVHQSNAGGAPKSAELLLLEAIVARKRKQDASRPRELLFAAIDTHTEAVRNTPTSPGVFDYLVVFNPDLHLELVAELLEAHDASSTGSDSAVAQVDTTSLRRAQSLLESVSRYAPGATHVTMLSARVRFALGEFEAALKAAETCIEREPQLADAYVLAADVHLRNGDFKRAQHALELGVSNNFELRDHPRFQLANARVLKAQGRFSDAVAALQNLLKSKLSTAAGRQRADANRPLNRAERVSAYLELIETQRVASQEHEAVKTMQDALNEFRGTPDELRLQLANADLAAQRGDVDSALETLRAVQPGDPAYRDARQKMARILLTFRKDRRAYANIYRELAERTPNRDNYVMLGDALMRILEVDRAVEAYEQALKAQPRDLELTAKIGRAYVRTHNYSKAVTYYETAIGSASKMDASKMDNRVAYQTEQLRADLAELLIRLRQFEKAERILRAAIERDGDDNPSGENAAQRNELLRLRVRVRFVSLLARLLEEQSSTADASKLWLEARTLQQRVIKKAQIEAPESVGDEKALAATISEKLAEFTLSGVTESGSGDDRTSIEEAMKLYREALTYTDRNPKALLALTKLSLRKGDHSTCQQYCQMLIKQDPKNIQAVVTLGEVLYVKGDCAAAIAHYDTVLAASPACFEVLARQLDFKRWTGELESPAVKEYFTKAEKVPNVRCESEPGFHFCRGLYEWYAGNANAALRYFNMARKDQHAWGIRTLINMIEICLNPDNDIVGSEVADELEASAQDDASGSSKDRDESRSMAIRTAETLLKELKTHVASASSANEQQVEDARIRLRLLENMLLVSTKQKAKVQQAIADLTQFMNEHADHVGGSYALACAAMMLKDSNKARGYLKKVHRIEWSLENALDLERALLLVCDKLIHGGNPEQAVELLKKCVSNNRACVKAHELLGYVAEKEQNYKDAAKHYQAAWRYSGMQQLAIGFKLAFTYLKLKRYADAMQVCDKVVRKDANYPKIKKEIYEKSRTLLKQ